MNSTFHLPYLVGTGLTEITPPLEVGMLMSAMEQRWTQFQGVRMPLYARSLMITYADYRVVLVSLDLLGLSELAVGGMKRFKTRIIEAARAPLQARDLILASTHTHTAPEALGITDLHQTPIFKSWIQALTGQIAAAISAAAQSLRPARLAFGTGRATGLGIHRRIHTTQGVVLSHPEPPPETVVSRDGPVDDSVQVTAFVDRRNRYAALLVNAACHPVHEMCHPRVSPDYPGEMCNVLEQQHDCMVLFFNGAAGNVNPPTVSGGPAAARQHGLQLAAIVNRVLSDKLRFDDGEALTLLWRRLNLRASGTDDDGTICEINTKLAALRLGGTSLVFIPGEPFAETGLAIRQHSPFLLTSIVGGADASVGYIPTDEAFEEGGYETGPGRWSTLLPGSERIIRREALSLLNVLMSNADAEAGQSVSAQDSFGLRFGVAEAP